MKKAAQIRRVSYSGLGGTAHMGVPNRLLRCMAQKVPGWCHSTLPLIVCSAASDRRTQLM